jgi:hypothetical protein
VTRQQATAFIAFIAFLLGVGTLMGLGVVGRTATAVLICSGLIALYAYTLRRK